MIFNFLFLFFGLLNSISASKTLKNSPAPASSPSHPKKLQATRKSLPIAQLDFLVTPDDFHADPDVLYLLNQLHRPQTIEKFYRSAARIYDDLAVAYREIQGDAQVAERFLDIMKRLTAASLTEPLSVTNLIFAAAKHLRPLFTHKSGPIEEMYQSISFLEQDKSRKLIWIMTQFFLSFTLREVTQIQDFIRVVSLATLVTEKSETSPAAAAPALKAVKKSGGKAVGAAKPKGKLDISRTSLESYAKRIRVTISNAFAKMLILLDLFVSDPTVINRSINLVNRLWALHLRRLAQRENITVEELDDKWRDPILYRKSAINFTFDDWNPDTFTAEAMAELRKAAASEEELDKAAFAQQSSSKIFTRALWITAILLLVSSSCTAVYFYFKRRKNLQQQQQQQQQEQEQQIDLTSFETQSINEIVSKLESNVE